MDSDDEADAAIQNLDGNDHLGRRLTVHDARPRSIGESGAQDRERGGGGRGSRGGDTR
jgi:hypothetical protein